MQSDSIGSKPGLISVDSEDTVDQSGPMTQINKCEMYTTFIFVLCPILVSISWCMYLDRSGVYRQYSFSVSAV